MSGKHIGYVRVSTTDQNTARQLDGIELDRVFEDHASGKDTQRPQLAACLDYLRDGDVLIVHSLDRLARNLDDLRRIVRDLNERGVEVRFLKENLCFTTDTASPMATLMLSLLGAFAQFERELIRERQAEGIQIAKAAGKYRGRKPSLTPERVAELRRRAEAGEKKAHLAREYGVSRETIYAHLRS